jgi:hypothetical protein
MGETLKAGVSKRMRPDLGVLPSLRLAKVRFPIPRACGRGTRGARLAVADLGGSSLAALSIRALPTEYLEHIGHQLRAICASGAWLTLAEDFRAISTGQ